MSCDWMIKCVDCDVVHHFDDANHMDREMSFLCDHAAEIATLASLFDAAKKDTRRYGFRLTFEPDCYGTIDPEWFVAHLGHRLRPVDEYGRLLGQCHRYVDCGSCGTSHKCGLEDDHAGDCSRGAVEK